MWKAESPHVRAEYERRADLKKAEHHAMYPQYRFQPVKKEEKERLREVKKQEKERRKEAQRRGRVNPPPPPPPPPASHVPRHYAPSIVLDPLAPYYQAEQRYGPSGPTPPISAANSPSGSSSSEITQSRVEESSASPQTNASPYPQTPSSVYQSPALPHSSFGNVFGASQSPEPDSSQGSEASGPSQWKDLQSPPLISTGGEWFDSQQQPRAPQEFLSFELPDPSQWAGHDAANYGDLQAILSATGDPSIFMLNNFDAQSLLDHPTGQLEVSLGHMTFPAFDDPIPNMSDFPFYIPQSYSNDNGATGLSGDFVPLFPAMESQPAPAQDLSGNYNAEEYLNFDGNAADAFSSRPAPVEQRSTDTSRSYVPPAGASRSSTRRPGGTWHRSPGSPVAAAIDQSSRSTWGVPA